ncbi:MAG: hypothetical protein U0893_09520 [Chloroflexota bacterium]
MIPWLNRYSYLLTTALAMGVAWVVGGRFGGVWPSVAVLGTGLSLALVQRKLRRGGSDVATLAEIEPGAVRSQPLLLFIYSDT